jgi:hypothetical protein
MAVAPLKTRLRARLGLKLALAAGLNLFAFVPYFWLQHRVFFPVTVMPSSALDVWLGFNPQAIWLYLSLFFLMPIAPMQMQTGEQLLRYALGVAMISLTADLIFFFWPTAVLRPAAAEADGIYFWIASLDRPLNAFPSLHAAMAVFSACCCGQIATRLRRGGVLRASAWSWALAIIVAMLLVKQHVALDAAAGIVLGLASYHCAYGKSKREEDRFVVESKMIKREGWTI